MDKRLVVIPAAAVTAVVAVGLSTAATMTRGDSPRSGEPADANRAQPAPKNVSSAKQQPDTPVATTSGQAQSAKEARNYWTPERMRDAQPLGKTRPGGTRSGSPAPSGSTAPGSAPTEKGAPQKSPATRSQPAGVVATSPASSTPGYWTDDAMADAQPLDQTRPGGSGSQGSPDSGGSTYSGSPPP